MRIAETFHVASSPERVFDYMTDPANLRELADVQDPRRGAERGPAGAWVPPP